MIGNSYFSGFSWNSSWIMIISSIICSWYLLHFNFLHKAFEAFVRLCFIVHHHESYMIRGTLNMFNAANTHFLNISLFPSSTIVKSLFNYILYIIIINRSIFWNSYRQDSLDQKNELNLTKCEKSKLKKVLNKSSEIFVNRSL